MAVPSGLSSADTDATLGLVRALRQHCGPCRPRVVVTLDGSWAERADHFRQLGAFIIRNPGRLAPEHFHHFPASAVTKWGELICTDLADFLLCWLPGGLADLHPLRFHKHTAPQDVAVILKSHRPAAINLLAHMPPTGPDSTLAVLDGFVEACRKAVAPGNTPLVCTTRNRLDGITGTADFLLVHA